LRCVSQGHLLHWKVLHAGVPADSPFHRCALRAQALLLNRPRGRDRSA
jgi:hypothetical protein